MKTLTTRFLYTLGDLMDIEISPLSVPTETFTEFLSTVSGATITNMNESTELNTLWQQYLWFRFNDAYTVYVDVEHSPYVFPEEPDLTTLTTAIQQWCAKVVAWVNETSIRYIPLIQGYEEIKGKLLDTINSESTVLFNDTPQSAGNWATDPYTTNATKTSSKQDITTPIERLREIDEKLMSLYSDWSDSFRRLVMVK